MKNRPFAIVTALSGLILMLAPTGRTAGTESASDSNSPAKVYVPYKELKGVFEKEGQGVFLPYTEFQKLWRAARDKPQAVVEAPFEYLVSTARFSGQVAEEIASLKLELTIDILTDEWVQVPLGLSEVAVARVTLVDAESKKVTPLLRVENGRHV
ncbi:MAG: hypothetical protein ACYSWQ_18545, partial [Planctomycetota bacterium]